MKNRIIYGAVFMTLILAACSKKDNTVVLPTTVKTKSMTVNFSPTSSFTFFSFRDTTVIANSDSATTKWDFALRLTTFLVNSNASGPGNGGAILQDGIYEHTTPLHRKKLLKTEAGMITIQPLILLCQRQEKFLFSVRQMVIMLKWNC